MTPGAHKQADSEIVTAQLGRSPRRPWRVAARCAHGYPSAIVSPALLEDGERFPTLAWLTCPWLTETCASLESDGATRAWAARAAADEALAGELRATEKLLRAARLAESAGDDPCAEVGIAGQRDPLGVKCLHAHVALALIGLADPIGADVLEGAGAQCGDARCGSLVREGEASA